MKPALRALQLNALGALLSLAATLVAVPAAHSSELEKLAPGLSAAAIREALAAVDCAKAKGIAPEANRLAIVDYTRPSVEPRLWIFDLAQKKVLFEEFVAHGRGSGEAMATEFSNRPSSYKTSLGLFVTDETYEGGNGYSLKLRGLSGALNDLAFSRRIVMHGAPYVNPVKAKQYGRLGRSLGCPAVRPQVARSIIDTLKEGQFFYAYGPGSAAAKTCDSIVVASNEANSAKAGTTR
jgi:hypothetical protein